MEATYAPRPSEQFNVPKPGFTLRYSLEPTFCDRVLYQSLADYLIGRYDPLLSPRVFSHRYAGERNKYIFCNVVGAWKAYVDTVKAELSGTTKILLATDIQNFFECITIADIKKALLELVPQQNRELRAAIDFVESILKLWSPYKWHGSRRTGMRLGSLRTFCFTRLTTR